MNPVLPHTTANVVALQCITRTTIVTESASLHDEFQNNGKENLNPKEEQCVSLNDNPTEQELRIQFQSSSGPPKKRLSPKRSSTVVGGNFDENLQPIKKSRSTDSSDGPTPGATITKPKPRPSESFEIDLRGKKPSALEKLRQTTQDPHDLVNAALYPSHPPDAPCYKQSDDYNTTSHQNHFGLKVQFVDDLPRYHNRKYSYRLGHIPPHQPPLNWQSLVSLAPRYKSRATVHCQEGDCYTPSRHLMPHPAYHLAATTPERWNHSLMAGPLISTPESLYYRIYGNRYSSAGPNTAATNPSAGSAAAPQVRFADPVVASTSGPAKNVKEAQPSTTARAKAATKTRTSTAAPTKGANKPQTRSTSPKSDPSTKKKTPPKQTIASKIIFEPSKTTKPCRCTKSHCLKLYCACFEVGNLCDENLCKCKGCKNIKDQLHNDSDRAAAIREVLKRKKMAFQSPTRK